MSYHIALVGAGPTAIYSVQALLECKKRPAAITIFERQQRAGQGTPYSSHWSDPIMLANIASVEIPFLPQRLTEWLHDETDVRLASFEIKRNDIDDRAFYPRLVIGEYLAAQFRALVDKARALGVTVDVRTRSTVTDVLIIDEKIQLKITGPRNSNSDEVFDYVILATGHQWPSEPEVRPGYFTSPWPATALARIHNVAVGIRGTSLSAIDASVALANQHGEFIGADHDELQYKAQPGTDAFTITLFSRKGILPEADFFHPIPYEPLRHCTVERVEGMIDESRPDGKGLLDKAFELFREEMLEADPDYAEALSLNTRSLEEFSLAYFDPRANADPFEWAREDLKDAVDNAKHEITVQWRYAILRMHEVFGLLPPHLDDVDYDRFSDTLKPVFVDNYATVPHESIKRLLALQAAKKLTVCKLDGAVRLDTHSAKEGALLIDGDDRIHFSVFIEATGQKALSAKDFPFPSLLRQGVIQDVESDTGAESKRGIAVDGDYHPLSSVKSSHRLFCLSLPFLLGEHPFAQGITSSAEIAKVVAEAIQKAEGTIIDDALENISLIGKAR